MYKLLCSWLSIVKGKLCVDLICECLFRVLSWSAERDWDL